MVPAILLQSNLAEVLYSVHICTLIVQVNTELYLSRHVEMKHRASYRGPAQPPAPLFTSPGVLTATPIQLFLNGIRANRALIPLMDVPLAGAPAPPMFFPQRAPTPIVARPRLMTPPLAPRHASPHLFRGNGSVETGGRPPRFLARLSRSAAQSVAVQAERWAAPPGGVRRPPKSLLTQATSVLYPCPRCVAVLSSRRRLHEHMLTSHCLVCSVCGQVSGTVREWILHSAQFHPAPTTANLVAEK
jgi:hypothetical protein